MPRLLFYAALFTLLALWARRYLMSRSGAAGRPSARPKAMPKELVCGGCGTAYDPHESSWICPKCGK